ncbi:MAG: class I SAM-dependent methyltransferase [Kiloniellales bacterium]
MSNQLRPNQDWDPARYARSARFVSDLGEPLLGMLAPHKGEQVLDLGCGDGALTEKIAALGAEVIGVDGSAEQVAAARARGLDAQVADGQALAFEAEFDAVFSNAALHWMKDQRAVIDGVWRALKPGGRFVCEMGGAGNVARIRAALAVALERRGLDAAAVDPWVFPDMVEQRALLEARGFMVRSIELFDRPTPLPGEMADWLEVFARVFLGSVPEDERTALLAEVGEALRPALWDAERGWTADYVRLRFEAVKPA